MNAPFLSIIIPTFNESANIAELVRRVKKTLDATPFEMIFVDDSTDETPRFIEAIAESNPGVVRLIARVPEARNGLSGAVLDGIAAAAGPYVLVMDGDLQHPPEVIPAMLAKAQAGFDFVMGSRYTAGKTSGGFSSPLRTLNSWALGSLPGVLFPGRMKSVTDPMSGFFMIRRDAVDFMRAKAYGWKIGLELIMTAQIASYCEVPYDFAERFGGESKASFKVGLHYFQHLLSLLWRVYALPQPQPNNGHGAPSK